MIKYDKLFELLKERGHSSNYWLRQNGLHSATVSKLRKNERINTDTINTICRLLNCQPADILEYVPDDSNN
ncbi:MAG TPA: XRE family transcriptional regulator [Lachnospiraceae bacterium]|nr:XRE family transcriptional regulator [Lachnospiraceae bacterium]